MVNNANFNSLALLFSEDSLKIENNLSKVYINICILLYTLERSFYIDTK